MLKNNDVFVVDADPSARKGITRLVRTVGYHVEELIVMLKELNTSLSIIIISASENTELSVNLIYEWTNSE